MMLLLRRTLHRLFLWRRLPCHLTAELFCSASRPLSLASHQCNGFSSRYKASAACFYGYRWLSSAAKSPATRELKEDKATENEDVEFDWGYICDPKNTEEIRENIANRKGVGDIDLVVDLWRKLEATKSRDLELVTPEYKSTRKTLIEAAFDLPNRSHPDVPIGDESKAIQVALCGKKTGFTIIVDFSFEPKPAEHLVERLGILRTQDVGLATGPRTYYLKNDLARLEEALVSYTLDILLEKGFSLISVPDLVSTDVVAFNIVLIGAGCNFGSFLEGDSFGNDIGFVHSMGNLSRGVYTIETLEQMLHPRNRGKEGCGFKTTGIRTQVYKLKKERHGDICLAGTGEVPIAGYFKNTSLKLNDLPKRMCTVSRCYRAETSDVERERGLYRVHQFTKVEMFGVTENETGEESDHLLREILNIQRNLFDGLGLHFRILNMPSQELGAPAVQKFDMETWLPARKFWGEISSASNCTDYQSRRLGVRYKNTSGTRKYCHTVNGTACAVPRLLIAILENNQNQDGSVTIPPILRPYLDNLDLLIKQSSVDRLQPIRQYHPGRQPN